MDQLDRIEDKLDSLERHVEGDGTPMAMGLRGLVEEHGKQIEMNTVNITMLQRSFDRIKWTVAAAASAGAFASGGLVSWVQGGGL